MRMLVDQMLQRDLIGKRPNYRPSSKVSALQILSKLLVSKGSKAVLIQNGVLEQILEKLHDIVSSSILSYIDECVLILKSLLTIAKNSQIVVEKLTYHTHFLTDMTKLLNLRNFKILKLVLVLLQCMCKSEVDEVYSQLAREDFLHHLQYHTTTKNIVIQRESLNLLNLLTSDPGCQTQIYNCGMFHNIILTLSSFNYEFKFLALEIISRFIPSKDASIDALILKYAFDILIQFIVIKLSDVSTDLGMETQRNIWKGIQFYSLHILAYLSDYNRIHSVLLQPHILRQVTSYLLEYKKRGSEWDTVPPSPPQTANYYILRSELTERSFLSCLLFSNLSKFRAGQQQIYDRGDSNCILLQLLRVFEITIDLSRKIGVNNVDTISNTIISKEEYVLLPKVVSRTIANMSSFDECHSFLLKSGVIDTLIGAIQSIKERTVVWNSLCTISNLCDANQELPNSVHELFVIKSELRAHLARFVLQKEDAKLQSRAMRIFGKLSRSPKTLASILTVFNLEKIVQFMEETNMIEVKTEGVRILTHCLTHFPQTEDKKLLDSRIVELSVKLSYSSDSTFLGDVCRLIYQISMLNQTMSTALSNAGALQRLWQLKEVPATDKIRKYTSLAIKNMQ